MSGTVLHASAVLVGEAGILILGPAGIGKSTLARVLVAEADRTGGYGRLVADDRVAVLARHGRLVARAVAPLEGLVEIRGIGIVALPVADAAVIRLVLHLDPAPCRMPEAGDGIVRIEGIAVPRITVNPLLALSVAAWWLRHGCDADMTAR